MPAARERWLVSIESANSVDELLDMLPNADAAALQGLLRRHQLPDLKLQTERVDAIRKAVAAGTITPQALLTWRDDVLAAESAIEGISDFRKRHDVIEAFRQEHNGVANEEGFVPPPGKDRVVFNPGRDSLVLENIRKEIWRENVPLAEWVEFLDACRDETDRHVFLYRLPHINIPSPLVNRKFTWKPKQPVLNDCKVDDERKVRLKWVGWRAPGARNPRGMRVVSFATVHPERRRMELCIQRLRGGGMKAVVDERDTYLREAAAQLKLRPEAVRLEPAIRELLKNKRLKLKYWLVRTPKGGALSGKGEPGLFEQIRLGFDRYYALELKGSWSADDDLQVDIGMNARTDAIEVRTQCTQKALTDLISSAWDNIDKAPVVSAKTTDDGETPAKQDPKEDAVRGQLEKLVEYLTRLGEPVPLGRPPKKKKKGKGKEKENDVQFAAKTRKDLRFSAKTLEDALQRFGVRAVGLTLYIMCPDTMTPASLDGQVIEFDRPGDIPETISCDHKGKARPHRTQDNVWLKVGPPTGGGDEILRWIWLAFSLYFPLDTFFWVWLISKYGDAKSLAFIAAGFLLSALAPIAAIRWLYGPAAFKAAADMVRWLLDAVLSKNQSDSEDQDDSENQDDSGADDGDDDDEDEDGDEKK